MLIIFSYRDSDYFETWVQNRAIQGANPLHLKFPDDLSSTDNYLTEFKEKVINSLCEAKPNPCFSIDCRKGVCLNDLGKVTNFRQGNLYPFMPTNWRLGCMLKGVL